MWKLPSPLSGITKLKSFCKKNLMDYTKSLLVVVIGSTGTGKSKLAIDLALKLNGEIVSADSMQVYKGLDIATAKVTEEEKALVKHHLLDYVDPLHSTYTVHDFKSQALPCIQDIVSRNKVPIVVGGTNYYIESLLWKVLISDQSPSDDIDIHYKKKTNDELYSLLQTVDPETAKITHPNDRRKVLRSLQVYYRMGRPLSDFIEQQKSLKGGSLLGGPLRFSNACFFWIQCEQQVLNERLDKRVDDMIKAGLINELQDFHQKYNKKRLEENSEVDYTSGIFQSIGFKEFHEYLLMGDEQNSHLGLKMLNEGITLLKQRTRRYSKVQLKWINNRFLYYSDRQVPPIFALDSTDVTKWDEKVLQPALDVLLSLAKGEKPPFDPLPIKNGVEHNKEIKSCPMCEKTIVGEMQWADHIKSKGHRRLIRQTVKVN